MEQELQEFFEKIESERTYQQEKWGNEFDKKNTPNDWIAYIAQYAGKGVTLPFDEEQFKTALIKVATLCAAAWCREEYAPRHYDRIDMVDITN